jgi:hypothetical protein
MIKPETSDLIDETIESLVRAAKNALAADAALKYAQAALNLAYTKSMLSREPPRRA